jgi:hypothetical protein
MNNSRTPSEEDNMDFDQSRSPHTGNDLENILKDLEGGHPYTAFTI